MPDKLETLAILRGIVRGTSTGLQIIKDREEREEEMETKRQAKAEKDFREIASRLDLVEALDYKKENKISDVTFSKYKSLIGSEKNVDLEQLQRLLKPSREMFPTQKEDFAIDKAGRIVFAKEAPEEVKRQAVAFADIPEGQRTAILKTLEQEKVDPGKYLVEFERFARMSKGMDKKSRTKLKQTFTEQGFIFPEIRFPSKASTDKYLSDFNALHDDFSKIVSLTQMESMMLTAMGDSELLVKFLEGKERLMKPFALRVKAFEKKYGVKVRDEFGIDKIPEEDLSQYQSSTNPKTGETIYFKDNKWQRFKDGKWQIVK